MTNYITKLSMGKLYQHAWPTLYRKYNIINTVTSIERSIFKLSEVTDKVSCLHNSLRDVQAKCMHTYCAMVSEKVNVHKNKHLLEYRYNQLQIIFWIKYKLFIAF